VLSTFTTYDADFDVPPVPGNPQRPTISLSVQPSAADFATAGARISVSAGTATPPGTALVSQGAMIRGACLGEAAAPLPGISAAEVGFLEDLANQILHSIWRGGHLHVTVPSELLAEALGSLPLEDLELSLDPRLPPVFTSCRGAGGLELQLGDLHVRADFSLNGNPGSLGLFTSFRLQVTPVIKPGPPRKRFGLILGSPIAFAFEVVDSTGTGEIAEKLIETLLSASAIETLLNDALAGAMDAFPVPELDLATLIDGLPVGSTVSFEPDFVTITPGGKVELGGHVWTP
jgi:hypothetical protein